MQVLHVIDHWGLGGAQRALAMFVCHEKIHQHQIAAVYQHHHCHWELPACITPKFLAKSYGGSFGALLRLRRLLKTENPDVVQVHLNGSRFLLELALIGLKKRPQIIWHEHSGRELKAVFGKFLGSMLVFWQRQLMKRANHLVGNSKNTMAYLKKHLCNDEQKLHLIHYLIDSKAILKASNLPLENIPKNANRAATVIGFVGRLALQKGPEDLLAVAQALQNSQQQMQLWVVGEGPLRVVLEQDLEKAGLRDKVVFWGHREDVYTVMQAMDVVVMPSRFEPFGLVALEAMILGKPVVAYAVDGLSEVLALSSLGKPVPAKDVAMLKATLLETLSNLRPAKQQPLNHPFQPEVICGAWDQLYCHLYGQKKNL